MFLDLFVILFQPVKSQNAIRLWHGANDRILCRKKSALGEPSQTGRRIDKDNIVIDSFQGASESFMAIQIVHNGRGRLYAVEVHIGSNKIEPCDRCSLHHIEGAGFPLQHFHHRQMLVVTKTETGGQISLRIEVDEKYPFPMLLCKECSDMKHGGSFSRSPFKTARSDHIHSFILPYFPVFLRLKKKPKQYTLGSVHIDIVVLHYKNRDDTLCCLQSLFANTYRDFTVHLVNNGTTDTFPEMPRVIYYLLPVNLGFAGGNNHVLRLLQEGATSFLLLNNDTWVPPDYLEKLALWATNHPGIIGSKIVLYDDPHTLDHYGGIWDSERLTFDLIGYRQSSHETALPLDRLDYVTG